MGVRRAPLRAQTGPATYEAAYRALGFPFLVRSSVRGSAPVLTRLLSGFAAPANRDGPTVFELVQPRQDDPSVDLLVDGRLLARAVNAGSAVDHLLAEVTTRGLRSAHPYVAVHAGAVSHGDVGVLFPGASGSGKSTLTCALVRDGFGFLSDEVALIEPGSRRVHPFPRPAALSPGSMELVGLAPAPRDGSAPFHHFEHQLSAEDLRAGASSGPAEVGLIVVPVLAAGSVTALEAIGRGEALRLLLAHCFDLRRMRGRAVEALGRVVHGSQCVRLRMGDVPSAVRAVRGLL